MISVSLCVKDIQQQFAPSYTKVSHKLQVDIFKTSWRFLPMLFHNVRALVPTKVFSKSFYECYHDFVNKSYHDLRSNINKYA